MSDSLRVIVAEDQPAEMKVLQGLLTGLGHQVIATAATGRELIERCRAFRPELVVADVKMPDTDGIEAAHTLCRELAVPIILVSAYDESELVNRAGDCPAVLGYLVKPVEEGALRAAIALAVRRFRQLQAVTKQAADLQQALDERKLIERAKGVVMRRLRVDEPEAFRRLKRFASDRNLKLAEVARKILVSEEAFHALETR
jgi:response regulator NasT